MDYAASILARLPNRKRAIGLDRLVKKIRELPAFLSRSRRVLEAYRFAEEAHHGQRRKTGEPYISHPVAVADLLADLHLDSETIMAALLHDVIEDTGAGKAQVTHNFRQGRCGTGRRRQQAGSDQVPQSRGSAGRELSQDDAGDGR